jgi:nitrogen fixation protein NifU and related proteins
MSDMEDLYQDIILDHHKRPRNYRLLRPCTHEADGRNPLCGDEMHVTLRVEGDRLAEIGFEANGCAISRASASLMTEVVKGRRLIEIPALRDRVTGMLKGDDGAHEPTLEEDGDLAAIAGVRRFPARIKCATLAWHTLDAALAGKAEVSTETED